MKIPQILCFSIHFMYINNAFNLQYNICITFFLIFGSMDKAILVYVFKAQGCVNKLVKN